jgi:hypothetical protein
LPVPFTDQAPGSYQWPSQVSGLYGLNSNYALGSSTQWNLAVEREITSGIRLEASYQGNSSTSTPTFVPENVAAWADGANDGGSNIQARRPNQFLGDNNPWLTNNGRNRYDQFLLIGRARRSGMFAQLSWAYTHARRNFNGSTVIGRDWDSQINNVNYPDLMMDNINNQTLAGFFTWDLPILKHDTSTTGKILGGWQVTANGFWSFANKGGSVYAGYDANADGQGSDFAAVTGPISYPKTPINQAGSDLLYQWFSPSAFTYPNGTLNRTFGPATTSSGANVLDQLPWAWRVDAGLMKNFKIAGDARLQLRLEAYNLFNHANLNGPNTSVNSADFGTIRGKYGDGRRFQLGLKFMF